eukprot:scaffold64915_cov45-Attheya_sp.AAC.8
MHLREKEGALSSPNHGRLRDCVVSFDGSYHEELATKALRPDEAAAVPAKSAERANAVSFMVVEYGVCCDGAMWIAMS